MGNDSTSLKIVNDVLIDKINGPGYVALGRDFSDLSDAKYEDFVKNHQGYAFDFINKDQVSGDERLVTWKDDQGNVFPIYDNNAPPNKKEKVKIKVEADNPNDGGKPKTVISVPSEPLSNNLGYLTEYVDFIKTATHVDAAKFLLGMMLITRCR